MIFVTKTLFLQMMGMQQEGLDVFRYFFTGDIALSTVFI